MEVKEISAQPFVGIKASTTPDNVGATLGEILPEVWNYVTEKGLTPSGPPITRYFTYTDTTVDLEAIAPVSAPVEVDGGGRIKSGELPGGRAATTVHVGPYETISDSYDALHEWIGEQGLEAIGACWEVYLTDPTEVSDPSQIRTEIFWPVK